MRALELRVAERVLLAAAVADRVMVVSPLGSAGSNQAMAPTSIPVHQPELGERVERAVDAGEADRAAAVAQPVVELLGAEAAGLAPEQVEHLAAGAAGAVPGARQLLRACSAQVVISASGGLYRDRFQYGRSRCAPPAIGAAPRCPRRRYAALGGSRPGEEDGLPVVATTTQAADLAREVGRRPRARSRGVLAPTATRTTTRSAPGDVKALAYARPRRALRRRARRVAGRGDRQRRRRRPGARPARRVAGAEGNDPHWWQDPRRAERAVAAIRRRAREGRSRGRRRVRARRARAPCGGCARSTPPSRAASGRSRPRERTLVTTHDALGYYARRYGLRVVGTVIPSLSTRGRRRRATSRSWSTRSGASTCGRSSPRARSTRASRTRSRRRPARASGGRCGRIARPRGLGRRDLRGLDPRQHLRDRRRPDGGAKTCSFPR